MIRVLVVDDQHLVRTGMVRLLDDIADVEVVGQATSGEEALKMSRECQPQVVLMDIQMPGIGGLEATRKILSQCPDTKVLAVSAFDSEPFPSRLLKAGAIGFVSKDADFDEIEAAVRAAARGQHHISSALAQSMAQRSIGQGVQDSPFEALSDREMQICLMVVQGGKVQEISEQLHLSPKTVNTYRYRIFEKLDLNGDVELTLLALAHGIIQAPRAGGF